MAEMANLIAEVNRLDAGLAASVRDVRQLGIALSQFSDVFSEMSKMILVEVLGVLLADPDFQAEMARIVELEDRMKAIEAAFPIIAEAYRGQRDD